MDHVKNSGQGLSAFCNELNDTYIHFLLDLRNRFSGPGKETEPMPKSNIRSQPHRLLQPAVIKIHANRPQNLNPGLPPKWLGID